MIDGNGNASLNRVIENLDLNIAGEHLGDFIWWSHDSMNDPLRTQLDAMWPAALPGKLKPNPPAFRVLRAAMTRIQTKSKKLFRPHQKTDDEIVYVVVEEKKDRTARKNRFVNEAVIVLDKTSDAVTCEPADHIEGSAAVALYDDLRTRYVSGDFGLLGRQVTRALDGICTRRSGGVYFVPHRHADVLREYREMMTALGAEVSIVPQFRTSETVREVQAAAQRTLEDEITDIKDQIGRFDRSTRASTMEQRVEDFEDIRRRALLYGGILEAAQEDLADSTHELENALHEMIGLKQQQKGGTLSDRQVNKMIKDKASAVTAAVTASDAGEE